MGGPSSEELRSDETLTKYIDGEITDEFLLELFEYELAHDPELRRRVADMEDIKDEISSIFRTDQMRLTEFVKNEINNLVENSLTRKTQEDDNGDLETTDAEVLISSLIDGELAESETRMVEKLITENETYRQLYEQLFTTKINVAKYIFPQNLEPSTKVKMEIDSLVESGFETPADVTDGGMEAPGATEPGGNVIKLEKRRLVTSFNFYAQRLVPLAAVFVMGIYISPTLFTSGPNEIPGSKLNETAGVDVQTRGGASATAVNKDFSFVSIVQSQGQSSNTEQIKLLSPQESFHLLLAAPTSGEMFIFLETSDQKDTSQVEKGKTAERIGTVAAGLSVRYPAEQNLTVDNTDKLLRIDIEIRSDDKIFRFTEFVTINQG